MELIFLLLIFNLKLILTLSKPLEVICPPFAQDSAKIVKIVPSLKSSNNDYCQCSLQEHGSSKTAILKCEFNFEEDIILKETLFPFGDLNITSAYVRMRNAKSAIITGKFLSAWMDAPSSALDLWQCGEVNIEPTPQLHHLQLFTELKTFVGVGIIDCSIQNIPSLFLRDRSRGAFRLKGCKIGKINAGVFHNINEMRYMNIEDSIVDEVAGPLSSSGVITLSKKEIHTWDGIKFSNSSIKYIAPASFNVTHFDEMEQFSIANCSFGKVEKGAISATGDIDLSIVNSSFSNLGSFAIQAKLRGRLSFSKNVIKSFVLDSLHGLKCNNESTLKNNTFYVSSPEGELMQTQFTAACGKPKVSYIVSTNTGNQNSGTPSFVVVFIVLTLAVGCAAVFWCWKNRIYFRFHYRRTDTPLWREEKSPDAEENNSNNIKNIRSESNNTRTTTFTEIKLNT